MRTINVDTGMQNLEVIQANRTSQKSSGVAGLAAAGMDPFALIFEQMSMAMGQTQEGDQEDESKDTDNLMMQLAGGTTVQNPQLLAFFQQDDASAAELVSELKLAGGCEAILAGYPFGCTEFPVQQRCCRGFSGGRGRFPSRRNRAGFGAVQ